MQFDTSVSIASMPSRVGRPPPPPATRSLRPNRSRLPLCIPANETQEMLPAGAAETRSGTAWSRAPSTVSAARFRVWARIATGAPGHGSSSDPFGTHTVTGR
jgi:hypothetical protein